MGRHAARGDRGAQDLAATLTATGRGDQVAFARLYDALAPRIYGLALRALGGAAAAEDATEAVLLHVWRTADLFDARQGTPEAWVMARAHRLIVDRTRSSPRREAAAAEVVELAYFEGRTDLEIARLLRLAPDTVRRRLRDELRRLRFSPRGLASDRGAGRGSDVSR